jgi:hypothetical protein
MRCKDSMIDYPESWACGNIEQLHHPRNRKQRITVVSAWRQLEHYRAIDPAIRPRQQRRKVTRRSPYNVHASQRVGTSFRSIAPTSVFG